MNTFSQRNVFDRVETAFSLIISRDWRRNLSPFLVIIALDILISIVAILVIAIFLMIEGPMLLSIGISGWMLGGAFILAGWSIALIGYWITANLASITTWLLIRRRAETFSTMEILLEAKSHLRSALRFDGYYYSVLAVVLGLPILVISLTQMQTLRETIDSAESSRLVDTLPSLLSTVGYGALFLIGYLIFSWWWSVRYLTAKPGFVLGEKTLLSPQKESLTLPTAQEDTLHQQNFSTFLSGSRITMGYFWAILGNMIVLSIVLVLASGIVKNLLGGFFDPWGGFASVLQTDTVETIQSSLPTAMTELSLIGLLGSMTLSLIISTLSGIMRNSFASVVWEELTSEGVEK